VVDTLGPLHFPRQTREGATQFLSAQRIFQEFLPGEKLPLRLVRKVFFQPAFHLFELGAKVRGEEPVGLSWPSEEKPFYRRGRKHRARKRKRRGAGGKPAVEGIPPGHQNP
jgi:hypothetical protein